MELVHHQKSSTGYRIPIYLVCVFRDEALLLEYFLKYYQNLGVTHFIMVDNLSEDNGPSFLKAQKNVNLWLYHAEDSYKEANYGTTWVNELLKKHCLDRYCLIVDADELFIFDTDRYKTIFDLIAAMEMAETNVVATTLLDMYPKVINDDYRKGESFLRQSHFFDDYNSVFYKKKKKVYEKFFYMVGGFRSRAFGVNVCIQKFPFFKYNFYPIGVYPGHHFFQYGGQQITTSEKIILHDHPGIILHFKLLKTNLIDFFKKRIENNQDWNNSFEYKSYIKHFKKKVDISFYHKKFSRKLITEKDLKDFFQF